MDVGLAVCQHDGYGEWRHLGEVRECCTLCAQWPKVWGRRERVRRTAASPKQTDGKEQGEW